MPPRFYLRLDWYFFSSCHWHIRSTSSAVIEKVHVTYSHKWNEHKRDNLHILFFFLSFFLKITLEEKLPVNRLSKHCANKVHITKKYIDIRFVSLVFCMAFLFTVFGNSWVLIRVCLTSFLFPHPMKPCHIAHCSTQIVSSLSNFSPPI